MNLGEMRFQLRFGLQQLNPVTSQYTDKMLNKLLNEAAQTLSAEAECFQRVCQKPTTAGIQEYQLPGDVNKILDVKWLQGSLFEMTYTEPWKAQGNVKLIGTPTYFYIKEGIAELSPQGGDNDIDIQPVSPTGVGRDQAIGLYPCPGGAGPLTIWYFARHPFMNSDNTEPKIQQEFHRGIVEFAKYWCWEAQGALAEADRAKKNYSDYKERLKEINSFNMSDGLKIDYRKNHLFGDSPGGTQWIYVGDAT
jgi:hypothetical protein